MLATAGRSVLYASMARVLAIGLLAVAAFLSQPATAGPECRCRLFGEKVAIGTISCIKGKLMQCLMFQNTPSWKVVSNVCPMAHQNFTPHQGIGNSVKPSSS
jgi:hypothetical protein